MFPLKNENGGTTNAPPKALHMVKDYCSRFAPPPRYLSLDTANINNIYQTSNRLALI